MSTSARSGSRRPNRVFCPLGSRCPDGVTMHDPDSAVYKEHVKMAAGLSRSRAVSASRGLNPRTKHGLATNAHKIDMWKSTGHKDLLDVDMKSYVDDELNVVVTREDTGDSMVLGKEKELELANIYDIEFGSAHDYVLLAEMIHGDDEIQSRLDSYLEDEYEDDPVLVDSVRLSAVARGSEDDASELSGGEHSDMMKSLHDYAATRGLDLADELDLRESYRGFGSMRSRPCSIRPFTATVATSNSVPSMSGSRSGWGGTCERRYTFFLIVDSPRTSDSTARRTSSEIPSSLMSAMPDMVFVLSGCQLSLTRIGVNHD